MQAGGCRYFSLMLYFRFSLLTEREPQDVVAVFLNWERCIATLNNLPLADLYAFQC
jgi:hypothetical protein